MSLLSSILVLLVVSRLLGELMVRLNQPAIVGEILAGVVLGPALLNVIKPTDSLAGISELSVFLIVLSAGLEMEFADVLSAIRGRGFFAATIDFVLPWTAGVSLGMISGLDATRSVFLGLAMSITALPVAVRILGNFKLLDSKIARYSIATSIINDVVALLGLGIILDKEVREGGATTIGSVLLSLIQISGKILLFALIVAGVSRLLRWGGKQTHYLEKVIERIFEFFGREAVFGVAVIFVLLFGSMSENLGSHFVIGAFFGASLLSKDIFGTSHFSDLENTLNSISGGFLAPIFFAYLGLQFSVDIFTSPAFILAVLFFSMASKIAGGYLGARWIRMDRTEALGAGIILNGRGVMELVVANIALQRGLIDQKLFSALVFMGVVTTVVTPLLFRIWVMPKLAERT